MISTRTELVIDVGDWDKLVTETYQRPYSFQQQDGCKDRQRVQITIPDKDETWDYDNDSIPEEVNGEEMGVSFKAWLERDPAQKIPNPHSFGYDGTDLFWTRNFYPDVQMVANDLYAKGLIEAGDYVIDIDW